MPYKLVPHHKENSTNEANFYSFSYRPYKTVNGPVQSKEQREYFLYWTARKYNWNFKD